MRLICTLFLAAGLLGTSLSAQVTVTPSNVANDLTTALVGPGVSFSSAFCNCVTDGSGYFSSTTSSIGIVNGIALTSQYV